MQKKVFPFLPTAAWLAGLASILLAIVDFRRGFLAAKELYDFRNPFVAFGYWQPVMIVAGVSALVWGSNKLRGAQDERINNSLFIGSFTLLVIDLGFYRGVAAARSLNSGKVGIDWLQAFGVQGPWKPLALAACYLATVWHAIFVSCLMAGLSFLILPRVMAFLRGRGALSSSLAGTVYSVTQPFCSCCVALCSPSLFRNGYPNGFAISVLLGAPLLNLSTLVLAGTLLPFPYAALRITSGVALTLGLSFLLSRTVLGEECAPDAANWQVPAAGMQVDPGSVFGTWIALSVRIALVLVPSMLVGTLLTSGIWMVWPSHLANGVFAVAITSVLGGLLMVSTWSEIPLALQMISQGLTGPAAAALIALPAVNFASLLIVAKRTGQWKLPLALGTSVMACAFAIGLFFL